MTDDLITRLRGLARSEHDDLSVATEAADEIERLRSLLFLNSGQSAKEDGDDR